MSRSHGGLGRDTMGLTQLTRMEFEGNPTFTDTESDAASTAITQEKLEKKTREQVPRPHLYKGRGVVLSGVVPQDSYNHI